MSEVKVNKISPRTNCGTVQLGDSGDTITIPAGATITNNGTQTGFGRTGSVDWQTGSIKTANFTAANGEGYFCNTSGGAFTLTLPASPSAGDIVAVADYTRTFDQYNLTIGRNSQPIGGIAQDAILSTTGQAATFVYVDGTEGWINVQNADSSVTGASPFLVATGGTVTTCGDYKIHTFTGPGTFTVCQAAGTCGPTRNNVSYLVVAGGGGGGTACGAGGAGAGGFREYKAPLNGCYTASPLNGNPGGTSITVTAQAYPITVGAGGAGGTGGVFYPAQPPAAGGSKGADSIFSTVTSTGGGQTLGNIVNPSCVAGSPGGSGGGGGHSQGCGGTGNTPPVSPSQGNNGGKSQPGPATPAPVPQVPSDAGAGGGGAGAGGATSGNTLCGAAGVTTSISGSPTAYAGGGGGNNRCGGTIGAGGTGGGGRGGYGPRPAPAPQARGENGTANTGGGGGGGGAQNPNFPSRTYSDGGTGGSGIVIIRYKYQ